jgi:sarcosine oxidase subunit gamma
MPETLSSTSALSAAAPARGVSIRELPDVGKIGLRGDSSDRAFMSAIGRVLDLLLPTEPCASLRQDNVAALWLGPDQWLITAPRAEVIDVMAKLQEALVSTHAAVTDVSAGRSLFRLSGPNAIDVLAKGCPLDLHPRAAKPGLVAGSVLAKITATVHLQDDGVIDLYVGRSFADYLWAWLENAGLDYGVTTG